MSTYVNAALLKHIHSTTRQRNYKGMINLSFIGANQYWISEEGAVWHNSNVARGKYYEPTMMLDPIIPIPWIRFMHPATTGDQFFPVTQLLGWAYSPYTEVVPKYYLNAYPNLYGSARSTYSWRDDLLDYTSSQLYKFMVKLYATI